MSHTATAGCVEANATPSQFYHSSVAHLNATGNTAATVATDAQQERTEYKSMTVKEKQWMHILRIFCEFLFLQYIDHCRRQRHNSKEKEKDDSFWTTQTEERSKEWNQWIQACERSCSLSAGQTTPVQLWPTVFVAMEASLQRVRSPQIDRLLDPILAAMGFSSMPTLASFVQLGAFK
jgi:hypothetical protein